MATQADVRRIACSFPEVAEVPGRFAFARALRSRNRVFAWAWNERVHPRKAKIPSATVIAILVADAGEKQAMLAADVRVFFTEPHYDGYAAVLVRLEPVSLPLLERVLRNAWECAQPPRRRSPAARSPR